MGDEELKKKRIRGGHKGYVTQTLEKIQLLLDDFEPATLNQLKTYRIALQEKMKILGFLDDEILGLVKEDQIEEEIKETGVVRESIHQMIVKIDETLLVETDHGITDKSSAHSVHSNSNSFAEGPGLRAKLPKITLKKFHGDPILFTPFWDSFVSAVDMNHALSDVDKFNYLRSLLEGVPQECPLKEGLPLLRQKYQTGSQAQSLIRNPP